MAHRVSVSFFKDTEKQHEEVVSPANPLPVTVVNDSVPTDLSPVDPLLVSTVALSTTQRDLFSNTASSNPDLPTLDNCLKYHTLLWTGFKTSTTSAVNYVVQARCGDSLDADSSGSPLANGWLDITSHTVVYNTDGTQGTPGTIGLATSAGHFRVVIRLPDGLYFDQYRILVTGAGVLESKIVGVRR